MRAKQRYILVFLSCAFLALCYFGGYRLKVLNLLHRTTSHTRSHPQLDSYLEAGELVDSRFSAISSPKQQREEAQATTPREQCRMESCFDFSRCSSGFRVYVHPPEEGVAMSSTYRKILNVITESRWSNHNSIIINYYIIIIKSFLPT